MWPLWSQTTVEKARLGPRGHQYVGGQARQRIYRALEASELLRSRPDRALGPKTTIEKARQGLRCPQTAGKQATNCHETC